MLSWTVGSCSQQYLMVLEIGIYFFSFCSPLGIQLTLGKLSCSSYPPRSMWRFWVLHHVIITWCDVMHQSWTCKLCSCMCLAFTVMWLGKWTLWQDSGVPQCTSSRLKPMSTSNSQLKVIKAALSLSQRHVHNVMFEVGSYDQSLITT